MGVGGVRGLTAKGGRKGDRVIIIKNEAKKTNSPVQFNGGPLTTKIKPNVPPRLIVSGFFKFHS